MRLPITIAAASAEMPEEMWTTVPPAKVQRAESMQAIRRCPIPNARADRR